MSHKLILTEFITLFFLLPLAVSLIPMPFYVVYMPMFAVFIYAVWWLFTRQKMQWTVLWRSDDCESEKRQLKIILLRFVICLPLIVVFVLVLYPEKLLDLPRQYPWFFLLFIVLYPVLSVLPQELLYRAFFFKRYRRLFESRTSLIMASAISFAFLHIIFQNYVAVLLTLPGGYFFAHTYHHTRSLMLVSFEHSLYGIAVFALGLGGFFIRSLSEVGLIL